MRTFKRIDEAITGQDYASLFQPVFEKKIEKIECFNPSKRRYDKWHAAAKKDPLLRHDAPTVIHHYQISVAFEDHPTNLAQLFTFYYDMLPSCCGAILAHTLQANMATRDVEWGSGSGCPVTKGMDGYNLAHELLVSAWEKVADESGHTKIYYTAIPQQQYILAAFKKREFNPVDEFVSQRTQNKIVMWSKYVAATTKEEEAETDGDDE